MGVSTIKAVISALEYQRRKDAHLYPNDIEADKPLRKDDRIRKIEAAVKHNQPKKVAEAQSLKAAGSSLGVLYLFVIQCRCVE